MLILKQIVLEEYMKRKIHINRLVIELLLTAIIMYGVFYVRLLYLSAYMSLGLLFTYVGVTVFLNDRTHIPEVSCFVPRAGKGIHEYLAWKSNLFAGGLAGITGLILGITYYTVDELVWNKDVCGLIVYIAIEVYVLTKEQMLVRENAKYRKRTVNGFRSNTAIGKYTVLRVGNFLLAGISMVYAWHCLSYCTVEMIGDGEIFEMSLQWKLVMCFIALSELVIIKILCDYQYHIAVYGDYDSSVRKEEVFYEY